MGSCSHQDAKTYTRDGADHHGLDLFVKCKACDREGPYVECDRPTPELRRMVWKAWEDDLSDNFIEDESA